MRCVLRTQHSLCPVPTTAAFGSQAHPAGTNREPLGPLCELPKHHTVSQQPRICGYCSRTAFTSKGVTGYCFVINVFCQKRREAAPENTALSLCSEEAAACCKMSMKSALHVLTNYLGVVYVSILTHIHTGQMSSSLAAQGVLMFWGFCFCTCRSLWR